MTKKALFLVLILLMIPLAYSTILYVRPPKIIIYGGDYPLDVPVVVYNLTLKNMNDFPVIVTLTPSMDLRGYLLFHETEFTMQPDETRIVGFDVYLDYIGGSGEVIVKFTPSNGQGLPVSYGVEVTIYGRGKSPPPQCPGTTTSCGTWPDCINCNNLDGCYDGYYRNYFCGNNQCQYSPEFCTDYCCKLAFGDDAYCYSNVCHYTVTTTTIITTTTISTTTTIPPSSTTTSTTTTTTTTTTTQPSGEVFLEENYRVSCPEIGYDHCKADLYRYFWFVSSRRLEPGESWSVSKSGGYYIKLYGVGYGDATISSSTTTTSTTTVTTIFSTTTINGLEEEFLEEDYDVSCPQTGYDHCKADLYRYFWFAYSKNLQPGESWVVNRGAGYYIKLYGIGPTLTTTTIPITTTTIPTMTTTIPATTTTTPSECGEFFLEENWEVTCPQSYDYCRTELYRKGLFLLSQEMKSGETKRTNKSAGYYYKLYGIIECPIPV